MPDISKCNNDLCKIRDKCYRYNAPDSTNQSYTNFNTGVVEKEEDCEWFMRERK